MYPFARISIGGELIPITLLRHEQEAIKNGRYGFDSRTVARNLRNIHQLKDKSDGSYFKTQRDWFNHMDAATLIVMDEIVNRKICYHDGRISEALAIELKNGVTGEAWNNRFNQPFRNFIKSVFDDSEESIFRLNGSVEDCIRLPDPAFVETPTIDVRIELNMNEISEFIRILGTRFGRFIINGHSSDDVNLILATFTQGGKFILPVQFGDLRAYTQALRIAKTNLFVSLITGHDAIMGLRIPYEDDSSKVLLHGIVSHYGDLRRVKTSARLSTRDSTVIGVDYDCLHEDVGFGVGSLMRYAISDLVNEEVVLDLREYTNSQRLKNYLASISNSDGIFDDDIYVIKMTKLADMLSNNLIVQDVEDPTKPLSLSELDDLFIDASDGRRFNVLNWSF